MKDENLNELLELLEKNINKDNQKVQYVYNELKKINNQIPTKDKLDELKKIIIDLEINYDELTDLLYYYDPLYVKIANILHEREVAKIREDNRRKKMSNNI